jgi:hypothetical protein
LHKKGGEEESKGGLEIEIRRGKGSDVYAQVSFR